MPSTGMAGPAAELTRPHRSSPRRAWLYLGIRSRRAVRPRHRRPKRRVARRRTRLRHPSVHRTPRRNRPPGLLAWWASVPSRLSGDGERGKVGRRNTLLGVQPRIMHELRQRLGNNLPDAGRHCDSVHKWSPGTCRRRTRSQGRGVRRAGSVSDGPQGPAALAGGVPTRATGRMRLRRSPHGLTQVRIAHFNHALLLRLVNLWKHRQRQHAAGGFLARGEIAGAVTQETEAFLLV